MVELSTIMQFPACFILQWTKMVEFYKGFTHVHESMWVGVNISKWGARWGGGCGSREPMVIQTGGPLRSSSASAGKAFLAEAERTHQRQISSLTLEKFFF